MGKKLALTVIGITVGLLILVFATLALYPTFACSSLHTRMRKRSATASKAIFRRCACLTHHLLLLQMNSGQEQLIVQIDDIDRGAYLPVCRHRNCRNRDVGETRVG